MKLNIWINWDIRECDILALSSNIFSENPRAECWNCLSRRRDVEESLKDKKRDAKF